MTYSPEKHIRYRVILEDPLSEEEEIKEEKKRRSLFFYINIILFLAVLILALYIAYREGFWR